MTISSGGSRRRTRSLITCHIARWLLLCRSVCEAAEDGGGGVGEELVRGVLRVCEPFDREAVEQRDDRGGDLVAWKCELHALVARYTFDDASDEGRKPRMPFDELDGGLRI